MSNRTLFWIAVNAVVAALGVVAVRIAAECLPDPKPVTPPFDARREFIKAVREGRVEEHDGLTPEFIERMNRRRWIHGTSR